MTSKDLKSVIKQVYNTYQDQDFQYGEQGSDNLNPRREVAFEQLDKLETKIQELTNIIVRKRLRPKQEAPTSDVFSFGESPNPNQALFEASLKAGGDGKSILGDLDGIEKGLLLVPDQIPNPNCETTYEKYGFKDSETDDDPEAEFGYTNDDLQGLGVKDDEEVWEGSFNPDEEVTEEDCAKVELNFLKILIIIIKVIKILRKIIELTLMPIDIAQQIAAWAAGAWASPPNIPQIAQMILEIVVSIVMMIISMLIQLLWNLLNLDCRSEQALDLIEELRQCLSEFSTIAGSFNVDSINFLFSNIKEDVFDPMNQVMDQISNNKAAWAKWKADLDKEAKGQWNNYDKQILGAIKEGAKNAAFSPGSQGATNAVMGIINDVKSLVQNEWAIAKATTKDTASSWKDPLKVIKESPEFKSLEDASIMASEKWEGLTIKKKGK